MTLLRLMILALAAILTIFSQTDAPKDPGWPRIFTEGAAKLTVYQPQIDSWKEYTKLSARFAVALTLHAGAKPVYGAIQVEADSLADNASRTVLVNNFVIQNASYPSARDEGEAKGWKELTEKLFPKTPVTVSTNRILAYMDTSTLKPRETEISLDPPPIFVSTQVAVLVIIDGKPIPFEVEKTGLQKIVNTNWDLFLDTKGKRYYLRDGKSWLTAANLTDA